MAEDAAEAGVTVLEVRVCPLLHEREGLSTEGVVAAVREKTTGESHVLDEIRKVLHPRAVIITRVGGKPIREDLVLKVLAFLAMYMATHAVGTLILAALGNDLVTSLSASLAALSSIGPGLGEVGPAANYGHMGAPALVTLCVGAGMGTSTIIERV